MSDGRLQGIHDRALIEHRRSVYYGVGLAIAIGIVLAAVALAGIIIGRVVGG